MAEWVHQVLDKEQFLQDDQRHYRNYYYCTTIENETNDTTNNEKHKRWNHWSYQNMPPTNWIITKIRQLGQRNQLETSQRVQPSLERVSRTLDMLGRKGETDWPLEWSIIEDTVIQNHKRLHLETLQGKPRATLDKQ